MGSSLRSLCLLLTIFPFQIEGLSAPAALSPNQQSLSKAPKFPRTWVPLASVFELDPDRPTRVKFLGQSYVAYQDNDKHWVVVDDTCPHRLAPLSEGRVDRERNLLECAYHGWGFDSQGACQRIPQVDDVAFRAAQAKSRCHVRSYSVIVEKNTLFAWVWPEDPLSVANVPEAHPETMMHGVPEEPGTYTRDLPYGWDTLLENIVDPSHVPFAHHGLQGSRDDAIPINMTSPVSVEEWGFSFSHDDRTMKKMRSSNCCFRAPFVIQYKGKMDGGSSGFDLTAVMTPTTPGNSRIIVYSGSTKKKDKNTEKEMSGKKKKQSLFFKIFKLLPTWFIHSLNNRFLDSDLAFLHYQERERERRGGDVEDYYFIPGQSDRSIRAIRRWVQKFAHTPGPLPESPVARSHLFDRGSQHTDHCKHCSKALNVTFPAWKKNALRTLVVSILLGKYLAARIVAVGCLTVLGFIGKIEPSFTKGGYDHYKT